MTSLHDELMRIAERAPDLTTDGAWERGRRARTRARVVTGAVAAAVLAVVAGLGSLLVAPDRSVAPVSPGPGAGAVPDRIWQVPPELVRSPEDLDDDARWDGDVAETDLAVGRGAVAFTVGEMEELPLVVTAADGIYHPLELPGWTGTGAINTQLGDGASLALSPDGRSLAYAWWDPAAPLDRPMPAGVRIVDLLSGELHDLPLHGGNGVLVHSLVWSADSSRVAWTGIRTRSWTRHSMGGGPTVAGVVARGTDRSRTVEGGRILAVSDTGRPLLTERDGRLALADGTRVPREVRSSTSTTAATAPNGSVVLLGQSMPAPTVSFLAADTGRVDRFPLDTDTYPEGALVAPLGWVDDTHAVALVTQAYDVEPQAGFTWGDQELAVVDSVDGSVDVVGAVEAPFTHSFTVAVDLMSLDRPTVDRPRPDWPGVEVTGWWPLLAGGGLLGALAALAAYVGLRRRRTTLLR